MWPVCSIIDHHSNLATFGFVGKTVDDKTLRETIAGLAVLNDSLGSIPQSIKSLTYLETLNMSGNDLMCTYRFSSQQDLHVNFTSTIS